MNSISPRKFYRWVALVTSIVMMLVFLAPTVSRAMALRKQSHVAQVCTAMTMPQAHMGHHAGHVPAADNKTPDGEPNLDYCALCVLVADKLAPPVQVVPFVGLRLATYVPSYVQVAEPLQRAVWRPLSRGPPV